MAIIDPLEAILLLCLANAPMTAIVSGRVASKHRFAATDAVARSSYVPWPTPAKALTIAFDTGGTPDTYTENQLLRLMASCWGEDQAEAGKVYGALVSITRSSDRSVVATSNGNALIYWVTMDGTPQFERDPDVQVDVLRVPLSVFVAEHAVP